MFMFAMVVAFGITYYLTPCVYAIFFHVSVQIRAVLYVQSTGRPRPNVYTYFREDGEDLGSFSTVLCMLFARAAACALVNVHRLNVM